MNEDFTILPYRFDPSHRVSLSVANSPVIPTPYYQLPFPAHKSQRRLKILQIRETIYRKPTHRKSTNRNPCWRHQPLSFGHYATGPDSTIVTPPLAQPIFETLPSVIPSFTAFITKT